MPFLTIKAPGVSDVVLPHVSVEPVGEVEEPGGIHSQQICPLHSVLSEDTMRFGTSVQNNFVLEKLQKNRESRPVVHADQDVRHHSGHLGHDPPLNLKHGKFNGFQTCFHFYFAVSKLPSCLGCRSPSLRPSRPSN